MRWRNWGIVATAIIAPGGFAALIEYALTNGSSGWIPVLASVAGGIIASIILKRLQEGQPVGLRNQDERKTFSPRTPKELVAAVSGLTEIAATEVSNRHIGHWLRVDGTISDISEGFGSITVHLARGDDKVSVYLEFNEDDWRDSLVTLNIGDYVSAEGKIRHISRSGSVTLEESVAQTVESREQIMAPAEQPRRPDARKILSRRTPEELVDSVDGLTEIAATEVSNRHIGHWLRVDGTISDISEEDGIISVYLARGDDKASVFLRFNKDDWRDSLVALNIGDFVSAEGKIRRISRSGFVTLKDCELLPPPSN